jgi:hypothetical protein
VVARAIFAQICAGERGCCHVKQHRAH